MHQFSILTDLRLQDALDILLLTALAYHLYLWFWGTKAFKALIGLLALGAVYTAARFWGLFLTTWVFQILWQVLVVMLIILFQSEIRQVLERINPLRMIGLRAFSRTEEWVPGFVDAVFALAQRKIGALIIFERADRVGEWVTGGVPLDGEPGSQILMTVFNKESPLHDGASLIIKGRIAQAGCFLPLSSADGLPKEWGTRHRAALGISERCDALVVVVSEERGEVSVARNGEMIHVENPEHLSQLVHEAIDPPTPAKTTWWGAVHSFFAHRWLVKLGTLALVSVLWFLLAGQQNFETTITVPLDVKNLPKNMEIIEPLKQPIAIKVRGLRKDASTLSDRNVDVTVDLFYAQFGQTVFRVTRDQIALPNDRVSVLDIQPLTIEFKFKEKNDKKKE